MKPICTLSIAALLCLCSMAPLASAQGSYSTTLSDNKLSHTFDCKDFELVIQGEPYDDGDGGGLMLSLVMNNQSPDYFTLVVFNDSFDYIDKVKKFKNPKIKFDNEKADIVKRFTKKKKEEREPLDYAWFVASAANSKSKAFNSEVAVVRSKESLQFARIAVPYGTSCNFHLPAYLSDKSSEKEVKISHWAANDFKITVEGSAQPDAELQDIESQFAGLGIDAQKPMFCVGKNHSPSLENQKAGVISQLTILKSRAEAVKNRYTANTKRWTDANNLAQRIEATIELVNGDDLHYTCSTCKKSKGRGKSKTDKPTKPKTESHQCQYCGHAARDLQTLATKVANSGNATQEQKNQAAEMLKCAKHHKDNVHNAQKYYNTIVGSSSKAGSGNSGKQKTASGGHKPCSYCNYSQAQFDQKIASLAMKGKQAKAEANKLLECAKAHGKAGKTFMKYYNSIK